MSVETAETKLPYSRVPFVHGLLPAVKLYAPTVFRRRSSTHMHVRTTPKGVVRGRD